MKARPLTSHQDLLERVREQLARLVLERSDGLRAAFFGVRDGRLKLEAAAPDRARIARALTSLRPDPLDEDGLLARVVRSREPVYLPDSTSGRFPDASLRSWYATPVFVSGDVTGVLALASERSEAFSPSHRALADALARTLSQLLEIEAGIATWWVDAAHLLGLQAEQVQDGPIESVPDLTPRQLEVIVRLRRGERPRTIARALNISPHTVRNHLKNIYRKLGVHSQEELLLLLRSSAA